MQLRHKHWWDIHILHAEGDKRIRMCRRCGAQCQRATILATLTAEGLQEVQRHVYIWFYRASEHDAWERRWTMPSCKPRPAA